MTIFRWLISALLAPCVIPLAYMFLRLWGGNHHATESGHVAGVPLDVAAVAGVGYAASYVLGGPLIAALLLARRLSFRLCVPLATLVGAVSMVVTFTLVEGDPEYVPFAMVGGIAAFLVSSVFCKIAGVPFRMVAAENPGRV